MRNATDEVVALLSKLIRTTATSPGKAKTLRAKLRRLGHKGGVTQVEMPRSGKLRQEFDRLGVHGVARRRPGHDAA